MAKLFFRKDGTIEGLYTEAIDLGKVGAMGTPTRASHVEPFPGLPGYWHADLSPVGGPDLGPFPRRSDALRAEEAWLNAWLANGKRIDHPPATAADALLAHVQRCEECAKDVAGLTFA